MNGTAPAARTLVLIVEDNPIDVRLLRYALAEEHTWAMETIVAEDGEKAMQMLRASAEDGGGRPDFVILDLNLPKRHGTEVLQLIRTTTQLQDMPVAIVSSSPMDVIRDKIANADVNATCYFTKPMDVDAFIALGKGLRRCYEEHSNSAPAPRPT